MPAPDKLQARLESALKIIYLMFNEGYSALEGEELVRTDLCHEAIRLLRTARRTPRHGRAESSCARRAAPVSGRAIGGEM